MSELDRELTLCLEPVRAPESVWYRVEAELFPAPRRPRSILRPALGLLMAAVICVVAWSIGSRTPPVRPSKASALPDNSRHACMVCHG
jgi:hypothetical protein